MSKAVAPLTVQTNPENTAYLDAMGDSQQDTCSVKIHIRLQEATFKIDRYWHRGDSHSREAMQKSKVAKITEALQNLKRTRPTSITICRSISGNASSWPKLFTAKYICDKRPQV